MEEYENVEFELNVLIEILGAFSTSKEFYEFLQNEEERFYNVIKNTLKDLVGELANYMAIRSDIGEIEEIGGTEKPILVENLEECYLIIREKDFTDILERDIKEALKIKLG